MSEREDGSSSRHLWMILGLALLVRAIVWLPGATYPERFSTADSVGYLALARDLHAGYLEPQSSTFTMGLIRTPAYPIFLGALLTLFQGSVRAAVAVQIGISLLTVWLTYVVASRLIGHRAAVGGGLLLAIDPTSALFSCLVQPETLFTALLMAGTLCWLSALQSGGWKLAVSAGLMLGVAALTRPIGLFLPLCLAPAVWLQKDVRHRARLLLCFLLASSVPVGLWMAKNRLLTGFAVFSIAGDSSLLEYRAAGALAEDEGIPLSEARARVWQTLLAMAPPAQSVAELSSRQRALAVQILAEHPRGVVMMMSHGVLRMMAGTGLTALSNLVGDPDPEGVAKPWKRGVQALQLLALGIAYLAVFRAVILLAGRREFLTIALTLGIIVYFALFSAGPEANTRFRFPIAPFLAILAGHGLSASFARSRNT